jgi:DNA repair and recombination protein RAD54 and RAD54-like protein
MSPVKSFTVLFYKRTNKVNKSKGVAKIDGTLKVDPNSGSLVLRDASAEHDNEPSSEEETEKAPRKKMTWKQQKAKMSKNRSDTASVGIIFSGKNMDVAKRILQEDDVVVLGGYDVQIVSSQSTTVPMTKNPPASAASVVQAKLPAHGGAAGTKLGMQTLKPSLPLKRKAVPLLSKRAPLTSNIQASVPGSSISRAAGAAVVPFPSNMHHKKPIITQAAHADTKAVLSSKTLNKNPIRQQTTTLLKIKRRAVSSTSTQPGSMSNNHGPKPSASVLPHIPLPACIRSTLRPHQVTGVDFIWRCLTGSDARGAILGDEMGLGKSLMTIAVICALHRHSRDKQFVIVCPSSLVSNWGKEFDKWIGPASQPKRVIVKKGGEEGLKLIRAFCSSMKNTNTKLSNHLGQVLIISYDLFRMNADEFSNISTGSVSLLAVDEGHKLKSTAGSATLKALETLTSDARLCITATPIQNCLGEFHSIANFVRPGVLGDLQAFRRDYEKPISASNSKTATRAQREKGMAQSKALEMITSSFMLRRLQKDGKSSCFR